jgi:dihydrolipoamide dehydrogenase
MVQGRTAGLHAAGADCHPADHLPVVLPIYTRPAIAQVGLTCADKPEIHSCRISYEHALQAHLLEEEGWLELFYDEAERVAGGYAVGAQAPQIASQIALAVQSETTLRQLADVFVAHPTLSELIFIAAREAIGY